MMHHLANAHNYTSPASGNTDGFFCHLAGLVESNKGITKTIIVLYCLFILGTLSPLLKDSKRYLTHPECTDTAQAL